MKFEGEKLRERRLEVGRSMDEVSLACSIPTEIIEAFEEAELDRLPHRSFAMGLLRSYCLHLELSPERYISSLEEALCAPQSLQSPAQRARAPWIRCINWPRLRFPVSREITTWLAVCGVLLLGWFAYSTVVRPTSELSEGQAQAAKVELPHVPQGAPR